MNLLFYDKFNNFTKKEILENSSLVRNLILELKINKNNVNFTLDKNIINPEIIIFSQLDLKLLYLFFTRYKNSKKILHTVENINYNFSLLGLSHFYFPKFTPIILRNNFLINILGIRIFNLKYLTYLFVIISKYLNLDKHYLVINNKMKNYKNYFYFNYNCSLKSKNSKEFLSKINNIKKVEKIPKKFCAFIISNPENKDRILFYKKLSKYKKINSFGRILNNSKIPKKFLKKNKDYMKYNDLNQKIFEEYKFVICFENSYSKSHITEKLPNAFLGNSIPIYKGAKNINKYFNKKSFISYEEYNSFDKMIKKIIELNNDDSKYLKMRNEKKIINEKIYKNYDKEMEIFIKEKIMI